MGKGRYGRLGLGEPDFEDSDNESSSEEEVLDSDDLFDSNGDIKSIGKSNKESARGSSKSKSPVQRGSNAESVLSQSIMNFNKKKHEKLDPISAAVRRSELRNVFEKVQFKQPESRFLDRSSVTEAPLVDLREHWQIVPVMIQNFAAPG